MTIQEMVQGPCARSQALLANLPAGTGLAAGDEVRLAAALEGMRFPFVPEVFLEVAARHPDSYAVCQNAHAYTYRELSVAASQVAMALMDGGLGIGEPVTIAGVSSFGLIAAALGVMMAGGVLVFIDQNLPENRKEQIARLVAPQRTVRVVPDAALAAIDRQGDGREGDSRELTLAEWPAHDAAGEPGVVLPRLLPDDASAYIFFTSGSSGEPKGVLGSHNGLAHFLTWQRAQFPIGPDDRAAQITALSFDVVLRDLLFPLTSGATIDIPERETIFQARRLLDWFARRRITVLHSVPSLMKAWLAAVGEQQPFASLRFAFFAGEPLTDFLVSRFQAAAGADTQVVNLYGPTETTLAKLFNPVGCPESGVQPIGKPQPGVEVLILRDRQALCEPGEVGEIVIRTPFRSHGYYRNAELTRQVFIPNPFRDDPDDLLYCTGDLGCLADDGRVRIFGRMDSQIKIRGVRIEPNEIEAALLAHDALADAAVTTRLQAGDGTDKVLLACVVAREPCDAGQGQALGRELRDFLRDRLQEAMVPSRIVVLQALPYLPNGKLDRKAIAALDLDAHGQTAGAADSAEVAVPFTDPRQLELLRGLEQILGAPIRNFRESFLDLGGDSLSFITAGLLLEKLVGRIPDNWEDIPLETLLADPALTGSAAAVRQPFFTKIQLSILIRALSIVLIVFGHATETNGGYVVGSSALFLVSGMSFIRFILPNVVASGSLWPSLRFVMRYGVPASGWLLLVALAKHKLWVPDLLMLGTLWYPRGEVHWTFWFLDVLTASILLVSAAALVFAAGWRKRADAGERIDFTPFLLGVLALSAGLYALQVGWQWWDGPLGEAGSGPFRWMWMFVLGGLVQLATDHKGRMIALGAFGVMSACNAWLEQSYFIPAIPVDIFPICVLALVFFKNIPVPRLTKSAISVVASSSLFIYICNTTIIKFAVNNLGLGQQVIVSTAMAVAFGVVLSRVWTIATDKAMLLWRARFFQA